MGVCRDETVKQYDKSESIPARFDVQCLHRRQKVLNHELVKGPWSKEEDDRIKELVEKHGCKKWSLIAEHLSGRIDKQCRERWHNHLDPAIKKDAWTKEEESTLAYYHREAESNKKYHFVVANAKFMLDDEEHFQEQLFERVRLFKERKMEQDFWLVIEPKFLDKFPDITKRLNRPAVALVSTNGIWIKFMKLRLDRVLQESFEADSLEVALACNPANLEFEKPKHWVAPYPKYEYGWWESFLPATAQKQQV